MFSYEGDIVSSLCCVGNRFNDWFIILFVHFLLTLAPEWVSIGAFIIYLEAWRSIAASRKSGEKAFTGKIRNGRGRSGCGWRYVKSVTVWIIQLLFCFKKLLFEATLSFTRFRGGSTLRFHSSFRPWAGTVCLWTIHQWSSSVTENKLFFFRTDAWLERTEMKPGGMAVHQESKIIRMKIIETEKKEEVIAFS